MGENVQVVYASTAEVAALLASGEAEYATLIEPQVTSAMVQNENVRRALSFETEWQRSTGTDTMIPNAGFGTTQTFLDENPELAPSSRPPMRRACSGCWITRLRLLRWLRSIWA